MKKIVFLGVMLSGLYLASCNKETVTTADANAATSARVGAATPSDSVRKCKKDSLHTKGSDGTKPPKAGDGPDGPKPPKDSTKGKPDGPKPKKGKG